MYNNIARLNANNPRRITLDFVVRWNTALADLCHALGETEDTLAKLADLEAEAKEVGEDHVAQSGFTDLYFRLIDEFDEVSHAVWESGRIWPIPS